MSPNEGLALSTAFSVACDGWTDEDPVLTYQYKYTVKTNLASPTRRLLASEQDVSGKRTFILTMVSNSSDTQLLLPEDVDELFVVVADRAKRSTTVPLNLTSIQRDPSISEANFSDYISNLITSLESSNNLDRAMQLLFPLSRYVTSNADLIEPEVMTQAVTSVVQGVASLVDAEEEVEDTDGIKESLLATVDHITSASASSSGNETALKQNLAIEVLKKTAKVRVSAMTPSNASTSGATNAMESVRRTAEPLIGVTLALFDTGGCRSMNSVVSILRDFMSTLFVDLPGLQHNSTMTLQDSDFTVQSTYLVTRGGSIADGDRDLLLPSAANLCRGQGDQGGYFVHSMMYGPKYSTCRGRDLLSPLKDLVITCKDGTLASTSALVPVEFTMDYSQEKYDQVQTRCSYLESWDFLACNRWDDSKFSPAWTAEGCATNSIAGLAEATCTCSQLGAFSLRFDQAKFDASCQNHLGSEVYLVFGIMFFLVSIAAFHRLVRQWQGQVSEASKPNMTFIRILHFGVFVSASYRCFVMIVNFALYTQATEAVLTVTSALPLLVTCWIFVALTLYWYRVSKMTSVAPKPGESEELGQEEPEPISESTSGVNYLLVLPMLVCSLWYIILCVLTAISDTGTVFASAGYGSVALAAVASLLLAAMCIVYMQRELCMGKQVGSAIQTASPWKYFRGDYLKVMAFGAGLGVQSGMQIIVLHLPGVFIMNHVLINSVELSADLFCQLLALSALASITSGRDRWVRQEAMRSRTLRKMAQKAILLQRWGRANGKEQAKETEVEDEEGLFGVYEFEGGKTDMLMADGLPVDTLEGNDVEQVTGLEGENATAVDELDLIEEQDLLMQLQVQRSRTSRFMPGGEIEEAAEQLESRREVVAKLPGATSPTNGRKPSLQQGFDAGDLDQKQGEEPQPAVRRQATVNQAPVARPPVANSRLHGARSLRVAGGANRLSMRGRAASARQLRGGQPRVVRQVTNVRAANVQSSDVSPPPAATSEAVSPTAGMPGSPTSIRTDRLGSTLAQSASRLRATRSSAQAQRPRLGLGRTRSTRN